MASKGQVLQAVRAKTHLTNRYRNTGKTLTRVMFVDTPQIH